MRKLSKMKTYVYIDASNIRSACLKTLDMKLDFYKFMKYLKNKYPRLMEVRYYEGISVDDDEKADRFKKLQRCGYIVQPLERRAYYEAPVYKNIRCRNCGQPRKVQIHKAVMKMKSNVDVFLAAELMEQVHYTHGAAHIILVSCDGDYAELIKAVMRTKKRVWVTVLATPRAKDARRNTLSSRLSDLYNEVDRRRYELANIDNISGRIK